MDEADTRLNPAALSLTDATRLLSAAGGQRIEVEMLDADLAAGAPLNADGTLNVVHYAAWLLQQSTGGERGD